MDPIQITPPKNDLDRLKMMVQLSELTDIHRAKVAVMRLKVRTETLSMSPDAKAARIAVLGLAESLLEAEITQILDDTIRASPIRASKL